MKQKITLGILRRKMAEGFSIKEIYRQAGYRNYKRQAAAIENMFKNIATGIQAMMDCIKKTEQIKVENVEWVKRNVNGIDMSYFPFNDPILIKYENVHWREFFDLPNTELKKEMIWAANVMSDENADIHRYFKSSNKKIEIPIRVFFLFIHQETKRTDLKNDFKKIAAAKGSTIETIRSSYNKYDVENYLQNKKSFLERNRNKKIENAWRKAEDLVSNDEIRQKLFELKVV